MIYNPQDQKLLVKFADASDELLNLGVISTDSFTGEIGEYFACKALNLQKSSRVNKGFDGVCNLGNRYQVKAKIYKSGYSYNISGLNKEYFEFLVIIFFNKNYIPEKIVKVHKSQIHSNQFNLSNSNIEEFENLDIKNLNVPLNIIQKISHFAGLYNKLIEREIIRSRRIVGDIGEFYAANRLNLILESNKNSKGLDARDKNGNSYEIKTRRVYDSNRRISSRRRLNGLVAKSAKYLIVVTLDRKFLCSGMWIMPMENIYNPKSATLEIVKNTPEVKILIPSKISYLSTKESWKDIDSKKRPTQAGKNKPDNPPKSFKKKEVKKRIPVVKEKLQDEIFFTHNEKIAAVLIVLFLMLIIAIYG